MMKSSGAIAMDGWQTNVMFHIVIHIFISVFAYSKGLKIIVKIAEGGKIKLLKQGFLGVNLYQ